MLTVVVLLFCTGPTEWKQQLATMPVWEDGMVKSARRQDFTFDDADMIVSVGLEIFGEKNRMPGNQGILKHGENRDKIKMVP